MEKQVGPGFETATGYSLPRLLRRFDGPGRPDQGRGAAADVFVSASPAADQSPDGRRRHGRLVRHVRRLAAGHRLQPEEPVRRRPDEQALVLRSFTEPGLRLGTTDPATDPKGKLAAQALTATATSQHLPALGALATEPDIVFPEETLVSRLQSGQLDAGFFYSSEANGGGHPDGRRSPART